MINQKIIVKIPNLPFQSPEIVAELIIQIDSKVTNFIILNEDEYLLILKTLSINGEVKLSALNYQDLELLNTNLIRIIRSNHDNVDLKLIQFIELLSIKFSEIMVNQCAILRFGDVYISYDDISRNDAYQEKDRVLVEFNENVLISPQKLGILYRFYGIIGFFEVLELNKKESLRFLDNLKINIGNENSYKLFGMAQIETYLKTIKGHSFNITSNFLESNNYVSKTLTYDLRDGLEVIEFVVSSIALNVHSDRDPTLKTFICLIPIENIEIEEEIGIGNVVFLKGDILLLDGDKIKSFVNSCNPSFVYSKVILQANTYWEAYVNAKNQVEKAIEAIYHIYRYDGAYFPHEIANPKWEKNNYIPIIKINSNIFIQNTLSSEFIKADLNFLKQPETLYISKDIELILEELDWYEDSLTFDMEKESEENIKTLFIGLKFLRKSWDSNNLEEKLIFGSIALEFLVEDEEPPEFLGKSVRRTIVKGALATFDANPPTTTEDEHTKVRSRVNETLSHSLSNSSLMDKLRYLINRLEIPLLDVDYTIIDTVRKQRNDLVHGRNIPNLKQSTIEKFNSIIAKLIFYKLKNRGQKV